MFWGLIMEPQRRYSQSVKKAFHISMAALDESTSDDNPTQVICTFDDRNYLLCTLIKGKTTQVSLDLNYEIGDKISFATNGKAHVHLTGYLMDEQFALDEVEDEEEEEDEVENVTDRTSISTKRHKKDASSSPKKKFKTLELLEAVDSNDSDDSDDSDVNTTDFVEDDDLDTTALEDVESEEDEGAEEEGDEDSGDEEEDEDEEIEGEDSDEESSSLSEDEEIQVPKKTMENGVTSKKDKKQKVQQQQSPSKAQAQQQLQQQKNEKQKKNNASKVEKTPGKGEKTAKTKGDQTPAKSEKTPGKGDKTPGKSPNKQEGGSPQKRTIEGGVIIEEVKLGNGAIAKPGKFVRVFYEGRFKNNNKMFDSTTKGAGFEFRLGRQEVIKGWDVGVTGMKVGGKRRIVCPPNMAYGQKGSPPTIPPNSTLIFEVELKNVK